MNKLTFKEKWKLSAVYKISTIVFCLGLIGTIGFITPYKDFLYLVICLPIGIIFLPSREYLLDLKKLKLKC